MRLARLELYGFKSFPDRTTFHFGAGVSCVVGPNGSGKSNVVDALKWCVGEQSARSLRGSEMTDVIFAGSADRKPVGFAEVLLTLVTDDSRPFPGDYAALREVQVGRRLHRSGASEYTLNQTRVRRRDVIELLLDSGIGNDLYSFIEQGQVDKMISASPAERRTLIDEAAGISRYKARRDEARERLEATAAQLDRAADVVDEMARHLRTLEGQVLKAAEFRRLGTRVRLGELTLALAKHLALASDRSVVRAELEQKRAGESRARLDVQRREEDLERRREEIAVVELGLAGLRDRVAEIDGRIREANATAQLHERRAEELRAEAARAATEVERQRQRAGAAEKEAAAAEAERQALEAELGQIEVELERATAELARVGAAIAVARDRFAETEGAVQQALRARVAAESVLSEARRQAGERELRIASLETDRAERSTDQVLARQRRERSVAALGAAEGSLGVASDVLAAAEHALEAARGEERSARDALGVAEKARDAAIAARERALAERAAAQDRGRKWVDAAQKRVETERRAAEQSGAQAVTAAERSVAQEVAEARARVVAEVERQAASRAAEVEQRRAAAEAELAAAQHALAAARKAREQADAASVKARAAVAGVEAERQVVERQLSAAVGADELSKAHLPELRTVLELTPPEEREECTRRLGDRARWVVARTVEPVLAIGRARPTDATVRLVYWPEGAPSPAAATGWAASLDHGLAAALPVAGDGFRIEPGGFVTLGPPDALQRATEASRALAERSGALSAALEQALAERERTEVEVERATRAWEAASAAREVSVRSGAEAIGELRASGAERVAATERAAREQAEGRVIEVRERVAAEREQRRAAAEAWLEELRHALETFTQHQAPVAEIRDDVAPARELARAASERTEAARRSRESAAERRRETERSVDAARAAIVGVDRELAEIERRIASCEAEIGRLKAERSTAADPSALEHGLVAAAAAEQVARDAQAEARVEVNRAEGLERAARDALTRIQVERASRVERVAACRERVSSGRARSEEARSAAERAAAHAAELTRGADGARHAHQAALTEAATGLTERGEVWDEHEVEKQRLARLIEARDQAERGLRQVRAAVEKLAQEIERMSNQLGTVSADLEVLRGRMEDRYQVSLQRLLERLRDDGRVVLEVDADVESGIEVAGEVVAGVPPVTLTPADLEDERTVRSAVSNLEDDKLQLAGLGEVNLAAPVEYRELRIRHDELAAQRADLEESVEGIRTAIAKLNKMCRERFRETFDQVDEHFREVYPKLVGGGSARLALTDEEDLLETGVEIFVQPPGKRLQNLQLLSGGEKAMTAIALLIALFRVKPSPFCVLDEVDAPLDEANGTRFNEMLKEMSVHSQFLVITHNRKTMECADTLYGITMARPGVSRLVSVDLEAW